MTSTALAHAGTARRSILRVVLPVLLMAATLLGFAPGQAEAASATTGDLTVCAYGAFTRSVPIQLHQWNGSSWTVIRTGTTGTGCGTWRDVPANQWLAVTVKPTTYGTYRTCASFPGSWHQISGGSNAFYVGAWQAAQTNLLVQDTKFC